MGRRTGVEPYLAVSQTAVLNRYTIPCISDGAGMGIRTPTAQLGRLATHLVLTRKFILKHTLGVKVLFAALANAASLSSPGCHPLQAPNQ